LVVPGYFYCSDWMILCFGVWGGSPSRKSHVGVVPRRERGWRQAASLSRQRRFRRSANDPTRHHLAVCHSPSRLYHSPAPPVCHPPSGVRYCHAPTWCPKPSCRTTLSPAAARGLAARGPSLVERRFDFQSACHARPFSQCRLLQRRHPPHEPHAAG